MKCDVIVVGAGPAGLAFARGLAGIGLSVTVLERAPRDTLADPADDGREIALTHRSVDTLKALGAWQFIDPARVAPLRRAQVLNGASPFALAFDPGRAREGRLGQLVSNHLIRRALWSAVEGQGGVTVLAGTKVASARAGRDGAAVVLEDGRELSARLLVGADSRFSAVRDALGIGARVRRLGRVMLLARVMHERDHCAVATEWFDYGQTVALLPLPGAESSFVLTVPEDEAGRVAALDQQGLSEELTRRSRGRLGAMKVTAGPHLYPLATTWSEHFAATRAALIGDAAVGMHPVTAHGFNLGLRSAATLAAGVRDAAARGRDIASPLMLRRYEAAHRVAAGPIFAATEAIVQLFTDERALARVARPAALRVASAFWPVRAGVSHLLMRH